MNSKDIRKAFFSFFMSKKHNIENSAAMVVKNDPTLMFTNAGMNQFKDIFLDFEIPKNKRVANSQKCLRVGIGTRVFTKLSFDNYINITILTMIVTFFSSLIPARRALKLNPAEAVRAL